MKVAYQQFSIFIFSFFIDKVDIFSEALDFLALIEPLTAFPHCLGVNT
jgi:hypothetical protein